MTNFDEEDWYSSFEHYSVSKTLNSQETYSLQDELVSKVGLVISGKVTALAYSLNGNETWLGEYKPGDIVGLLPFLTESISPFEVRAETRSTILDISTTNLINLMRESSSLSEKVARDLALRLSKSVDQLINIQTLSVKGRICVELLRLSLPIGLNPEQHIIRPNPVFTEMARRLNSTRETVSRTINELQRKGILGRQPGAIIIESPEKLKNVMVNI